MAWYRTIRAVLETEPEVWLAYLKGQCFESIQHLRMEKPRYRGSLIRLMVFFYFTVRRTGFNGYRVRGRKRMILVYVGTNNQKKAVEQTVDALRAKEFPCFALAERHLLRTFEDRQRYVPVVLSPIDIIKTAVLVCVRLGAIRRDLSGKCPRLRKRHLDAFLEGISNLVFFEKVLRETKPSVVVVSNDHNPENRALMALSRYRRIRIAYLQHASVSSFFPALDVDYAFLDGAAALSVYRNCEGNHPPEKPPSGLRYIFLSGQKKAIVRRNTNGGDSVGVALNKTDKADSVEQLVRALSDAGYCTRVRWHPGMVARERAPLEAVIAGVRGVHVSDPAQEDMSAFLKHVNTVIAGDSSIHLEAAVAGVVPIYYKMADGDLVDYYGYVSEGVCQIAKTPGDVVELVRCVAMGHVTLDERAIRRYSATFGTCWEGAEGVLVAESLIALERGGEAEALWGFAGKLGDGRDVGEAVPD